MGRYINYRLGQALNMIITSDMKQLKELEMLYRIKLKNCEKQDKLNIERILQVLEVLIK